MISVRQINVLVRRVIQESIKLPRVCHCQTVRAKVSRSRLAKYQRSRLYQGCACQANQVVFLRISGLTELLSPADRMVLPGLLLLLLLSSLCASLAAAQSTPTYAVIVIGAGVSGIKAAFDLRQAGRSVLVLEARTRPYGRVNTQQPAGWPMPIEVSR